MHKKYIRLSTLEMERMRRQQEFTAAQARADIARARVQKLDAEIAEILATAPHAQPAGERRNATTPHELLEMKHSYGVRRTKAAPARGTDHKDTTR